jgi:hypothetical protein
MKYYLTLRRNNCCDFCKSGIFLCTVKKVTNILHAEDGIAEKEGVYVRGF